MVDPSAWKNLTVKGGFCMCVWERDTRLCGEVGCSARVVTFRVRMAQQGDAPDVM